jgi:glycosyltransferase involved in cell wall biosynthesis
MVAQPRAGDAGNARYAQALVRALGATAGPREEVAALIAHAEAEGLLPGAAFCERVPEENVRRLARDAARALARAGARAAVFTYAAPLRSPCPVVLAVHDAAFRLHPEWFSRRDLRVLEAVVPRSARRARLVLALSETAKADTCAALGLDPDRVRVVMPAPDPRFAPDPTAAGRVRDRIGLDRYVLAVGDVHPRKNLAALAEAVRRLGDPALTLAIAGRPGHGGADILARAGGVWLGPVDDETLADLYRAAAVVAYPSRYEGFGLPVLEAMASGAPVVAARRGAIPEVAGDAGVLVDPTPEGIAEGLRAALEPATADRLRAAGPPRAARFTERAMGEAAWAALREAAG